MMHLPPELQSALLGRRMVFLRGQVDDTTATSAISQLLLVARTAPGQTIQLYVDSPAGSSGATLAVYDCVRTLEAAVSTICVGRAGGGSVLILAGGANGLRFALPHARIELKDQGVDLPAGSTSDLPRQVAEAARVRARWQAALVEHTVHSPAQVARDLRAGVWLSAAEARDYGLVDGIIPGPPDLAGN